MSMNQEWLVRSMTHTEFIEYASVFIFTHSYAEFVNNKKLLTVYKVCFLPTIQLTEFINNLTYIVGSDMKNDEF